LVENVYTPMVGAVFGQPDFSTLQIGLWNDATITYGVFLNALFSFLAVASAVFFFVVRPYNTLKAAMAKAEGAGEDVPEPAEELVLLREIRDALTRG
jgi:large conductance mechanosensitive channel